MGNGSSPNSKIGWDRGVWVPGTFKLDHLQPFQPILPWIFSYFFTFILGGHFLLPQRANNGKGEFTQLQNWMRHMDSSAWGIQTGPYAAHSAHFAMKIFHLFHLHTGEPILITQRANNEKREFSQLQKRMTPRGFDAWGIQTGPFAACWVAFVLEYFHHYHLHTGEPILITPEG